MNMEGGGKERGVGSRKGCQAGRERNAFCECGSERRAKKNASSARIGDQPIA